MILLVCIILAIAGVVAASVTGLIDYRAMLSRIPLVSKIVALQTAGSTAESYDSLTQENATLKKQVQALTMEVDVLSEGSQSNNNMAVNSNGGDGAAASGQTPVFNQLQQQVHKDLAYYYANMKPDSAVAILGNQDPQMVSEILYEMNKDQASPILAAMDPAQAAKLLKLMAGIDSGVKNQEPGSGSEDLEANASSGVGE